MATKDDNDTPSYRRVKDSGLGSSAAQHVENLDLEELPFPIESEADNGGSQSMLQESYVRELWRLEGKKASKLTIKGIDERSTSVSVSECTFETSTQAYSHGKEVPTDILENVRSKGERKSDKVGEIYFTLADHLQEFEEAKDCYLLPIENGLLISPKKIIRVTDSDHISDSIVRVEQGPRRGKVFMEVEDEEVALEATVSKDRGIAYRPGYQEEGGNFLVLSEIGDGNEATVYKAMDVRTVDHFAVKRMEISKQMRQWKDPLSGFLKLAGCEQTCRAYGVIVDEADKYVYFLMELLEGTTLMALLGDQTAPIEIPFAVNYTIDILKGLQYIHSKGMVHADINGVNIMIIGPKLAKRAIIIDTTGAREASSPKSLGYLWDIENAIKLLNSMLRNDDSDSSPPPWEASDEDQDTYDKGTIDKLQRLLKNKSRYIVSMSTKSNKIGTLLQDLQEISEELEDSRPPSDSPGSLEDGATLTTMSRSTAKVEQEPQEGTLGSQEEFKKLQDDFKRVNIFKDELKEKNKNLKDERDTFKVMHEKDEQEKKDLKDQHERDEQEKRDLKDRLKALEAEMKKMQDRAKKEEDPRPEE
ncbi:TAOK1 [Branchiostoma lanceolatum]|uniref:non-specific serine/threonine protein kinase n=1 Tax=Branchiostoma lanceolatum TaxID=7740 RepID=A0A8J9ZE23_BRALA|nr:TAOK1 [Branchiostoma lanceolatum]